MTKIAGKFHNAAIFKSFADLSLIDCAVTKIGHADKIVFIVFVREGNARRQSAPALQQFRVRRRNSSHD